MILQLVIAIAGLFVVGTLWYHRRAVILQKNSIQATLFNDISGKINALLGEIPPLKAGATRTYNWYVRLFNEFEALIFLISHKYLSREMEEYFRNFIIDYIEDLPKEYPNIAEELSTVPEATFCNLRKYYGDITKKTSPF